jgi:hypothetical protein
MEAIAVSMLRAVTARPEFKELFADDNVALVIEPWIRCGARIVVVKGSVTGDVLFRETTSKL